MTAGAPVPLERVVELPDRLLERLDVRLQHGAALLLLLDLRFQIADPLQLALPTLRRCHSIARSLSFQLLLFLLVRMEVGRVAKRSFEKQLRKNFG